MTSPPDPAAPGPGFASELPQQLPVPPEVEVLTPPGAQDPRPRALRSRNNVVAVVVLGLVLALGLGMGSWVLLGSPWFPAPATNGRPVVAGPSQEPTIAWNLQLDGPSEEVTAVGDDAMAVFDTGDPTAGLRLLSLVDGRALWETKLDEMPSGSDAQIWARWLRGTDRIIVDSFEPGSTTKTIAYLDMRTGEQPRGLPAGSAGLRCRRRRRISDPVVHGRRGRDHLAAQELGPRRCTLDPAHRGADGRRRPQVRGPERHAPGGAGRLRGPRVGHVLRRLRRQDR